MSTRRGGACVDLARLSGSPGGSRPCGVHLLEISAEKEPATRNLLFWVSLTGRLLSEVGMIHSHLPFRQQSHQEVKSLPEVEQVEWSEAGGIGAPAPMTHPMPSSPPHCVTPPTAWGQLGWFSSVCVRGMWLSPIHRRGPHTPARVAQGEGVHKLLCASIIVGLCKNQHRGA